MSPGLPGTGIGGLFYLMSAILMPFYQVGRVSLGRGASRSWRMVLTQFVLATGIIGGIWLTGWLIGAVMLMSSMKLSAGQLADRAATDGIEVNLIRVMAICGALAILAFVLVMVHVLRVLVGGPLGRPGAGLGKE